jgi:thiol-disulfide isomerase/thioredoxin
VTENPTIDGQAGAQGLLRSIAHRLAGDEMDLPVEGHLAPFVRATGWLNSEPLTPEGLRGRVVLVDFWTYTCINWLRTLPYLRAWDTKYRDLGLTIVGVHTPEFGFERDLDNIVARSREQGVTYPIAIDSDYGIWRDFSNHFWPAVYIADAEGQIRFHHFGESEYAMQEMVIQQLLADAGVEDVPRDIVSVEPEGLEVAADWSRLQTPETYLGSIQASGFAQEGEASFGRPAEYQVVPLRLNQWALSGAWDVARHAAVSVGPKARVAFRFHARDVNLVMGPTMHGAAIPFRVFLDGQPAGDDHGTDVDATGAGVLDDQETYQLIRQRAAIADRTVEIEFEQAGAEAYCFTFG